MGKAGFFIDGLSFSCCLIPAKNRRQVFDEEEDAVLYTRSTTIEEPQPRSKPSA